MEMLSIQNLHKTFNPGTVNEKVALSGVDLELAAGDFAAHVERGPTARENPPCSMRSPAVSLRTKAASGWGARTSPLCRSTSAAR